MSKRRSIKLADYLKAKSIAGDPPYHELKDSVVGWYGPCWMLLIEVENEDGKIVWATLDLGRWNIRIHQPFYSTLEEAIKEEHDTALRMADEFHDEDATFYVFKDRHNFFRTANSLEKRIYGGIRLDFN